MRKPWTQRPTAPASGIAGVAAIEFVIVFPVLLVLLFGTINVAQDLMTSRRLTLALELVADLITRADTTITAAAVDDAFTAAQLAVRPMNTGTLRVDVYTYFKSGNVARIRWQRSSPAGSACPAPVVNLANPNDAVGAMLNDPQVQADVVVAVLCMPYTPPVANFPLMRQIFPPRTNVKTIAMRPRQSTTLDLVP